MTVLLQRRRLLTAAGAAGVFAATPALAQLNIEISGVGANQIPIALQPMAGSAQHRMDILRVVSADLSRTGDFRMVDGISHTNLIFDVAIPFECKLSPQEVKDEISRRVRERDKKLFAVPTVEPSISAE